MSESTRPLALASVVHPVFEPRLDLAASSAVLTAAGGAIPSLECVRAGTQIALDKFAADAVIIAVQSLLEASVDQMVGPFHPGQHRENSLIRFGTQTGVIRLPDRAIRIKRPRVRRRLSDGTSCEQPIPAYSIFAKPGVMRRVSSIVMTGVSTRNYGKAITDAARAIGVSKSAISRELMAESEAALKDLAEKPLGNLDIVVVVIDGIFIGGHNVLVAMGVAGTGIKHLLGIHQGASENTVTVTAMLEDLAARGLTAEKHRLFILDGSKALRAGVRAVYGDAAVQRCQIHKLRNVCDQLPDDAKRLTRSVMRAGFSMHPKDGLPKLREHISWLQRSHPSAAASLAEGLEEMFTVNDLGLTQKLAKPLRSTNMIESPNSGLRRLIGRVTRWRDGQMVLRWVARALIDIELKWRRIDGADQLWILRQNLNLRAEKDTEKTTDTRAA